MADTDKRLFEAKEQVRKAKFLLDSVKGQAERSGQTPPALAKAQAAYDKANKRLKTIEKSLAEKESTAKNVKAGKLPPISDGALYDAPFTVSNKIIQDMQNDGLIVDNKFFEGQGAGLLVYTGKTMGKTQSKTGGVYSQVKDNAVITTYEINRFNTDAALKNKVIAMVRKVDPKADEVDAWGMWQSAVTKAAGLYAGGKGLKITPEDLLNRELAKQSASGAGAYTGPETTLARKVYDSATIKSWIEEGLLKYVQKTKLDPEDMADLEASLKAMTQKYSKTVVTDNRKGKKVVEENPAFSMEQVESKIKKFAQEKDPEAYGRTKSMAFFDWAMGLGD